MHIQKIQVMRGPNIWSTYRKHVIVMKLNIGELEERPTNKIEGFCERLRIQLPSLHEHRCSEDFEGGFFYRVEEGTWMGHVIEHIALEIQSLAGMECGYGRTRSTKISGVYSVVFAYVHEEAGIYAAKASVRIAEALIDGREYCIEDDINALRRINRRTSLGPSTFSIVAEAEKRSIPWKRLNNNSMISFGYGVNQRRIIATSTDRTSGMGINIACDKDETKKILEQAYIPVPEGYLVYDTEELEEAVEKLGYPLTIKPLDGNHGRGVKLNIANISSALNAFENAKKISKAVIIEQYITGNDYRFLVIDYKLVAVAKRRPPHITGTGRQSIRELIEQLNNDPQRGHGHEKVLSRVETDEVTNNLIAAHHFTMESILPAGYKLPLKETANISTGGTARDVTDHVHPFNKFLAERVARLLHMDICGIDIIANDISTPLNENGGVVIEVNASPGFRMHLAPTKGLARNVAAPVVDMLFRNPKDALIPVVAVTGTNGKTTTTRLIAHLARSCGKTPGFTTTEGIYIGEHQIFGGDCSGPSSAAVVLQDPSVDYAVLECARGGILRSGLGFNECDISIVTNVSDDHLGMHEIDTLEEMAEVKCVVPRSTRDDGYAILNADDDNVYRMRRKLDCNIALFSMHADSERIISHCRNGGYAAIIDKGWLVLCKGEWKTRIEKITDIPLTLSGRAECMIKNTLPAVLAAVLSNFEIEDIRKGLRSFIPSAELTPGRFNIFKFPHCEVMIDYAHNSDGYAELKKFLDATPATNKIGIVAATGDRRENDIINVGTCAAHMFDSIIIRHDMDTRGNSNEKMTELITQGIQSVKKDPDIKVISDECAALQYAIDSAKPGSFIVLCADKINTAIAYVRKTLEKIEAEKHKIIELTYSQAS